MRATKMRSADSTMLSLVFRLSILGITDCVLNLMNDSSGIIERNEHIMALIPGYLIQTRCLLSCCLIFAHSHFKKHTSHDEASNGLFNAVAMETESWRRVTSYWLTAETPPTRHGDSSIPTDVCIDTATTKLRVRRRSSWPTAAPEDASPLWNLAMDVLKSARRAFAKQSWSSGKHQSEYSC